MHVQAFAHLRANMIDSKQAVPVPIPYQPPQPVSPTTRTTICLLLLLGIGQEGESNLI